MSFVDEILEKLNIDPKNVSIYELAFTHPSVNGQANKKHQDYERLEFLGDSLVGFVTADLCYSLHPDVEEGQLTVLRSQLIRTESEAGFARRLGLGKYIQVGASFQGDVENSDPMMENVFESFIGALYLDQGLDYAYQFLRDFLYEDIKNERIIAEKNPKSELQEIIQAESRDVLEYRLLSESGPANNKTFVVGVYFEGTELGRGEGRKKQIAESNAAREALKKVARGEHR